MSIHCSKVCRKKYFFIYVLSFNAFIQQECNKLVKHDSKDNVYNITKDLFQIKKLLNFLQLSVEVNHLFCDDIEDYENSKVWF